MADNDMLNSLKSLLGDNADEKINSVLNALKSDSQDNSEQKNNEEINVSSNDVETLFSFNSNQNQSASDNMFSVEGLQYLSRIKNIIDEMGSANDERSSLLMSLRPYMRETRQKSIDNAIKILNLSRFSGLFKI